LYFPIECATPLAIAYLIRAVSDGVACERADFAFKELLHSYSWIAKAMMFDPAATATYCLPSNM
jgi:hypothetical protein